MANAFLLIISRDRRTRTRNYFNIYHSVITFNKCPFMDVFADLLVRKAGPNFLAANS